jgi:uncharacterized protein (TIGR03437 family)
MRRGRRVNRLRASMRLLGWRLPAGLLLASAVAGMAFGQSVALTVSSAAGEAGSSVTLGISSASTPDLQPAGLQWTLRFAPADFTSIEVAAGPAAAAARKDIYCVSGIDFCRCLLAGANSDPIPDGVIATATLHIGATTAHSSTVRLDDVIAVSSAGSGVPASAAGGAVAISLPAPPAFRSIDVVNAASYLSGPVAPGEILSLFGSSLGPAAGLGARLDSADRLATTVGDVSVRFDGIAAPLAFVQSDQINAIVPYGLAGKQAGGLEIEYRGLKSSIVTVPVAASAPGIFTADSSGRAQAAAFNEDGTPNSVANPARRGSILVFYGTGGGQMSPPGLDGAMTPDASTKPLLPVTARIGGVEAEVLYAGGVPTLVSGLLQFNVKVPDNSPTGSAVPLSITIGEASSQPGVTVSIQ